jgi:predicted nucleic acid-binding protein
LNVAGSSNALISARVILEADYERPPVASRRLLFWQVGGFPSSALADLRRAILDAAAVLRCVALDERIAMKMMEVPREAVPDLPDGVIAATALLHGVPILSRDRRIQASGLQTIW